ncbi:uncharacterized protein LOC108110458 [Drosophila eugracilis]|uniref:uncharacterized protein LOC108110458 n=1 Tax=Drosophila eugracilis TaxID=29029 RepID=UPI001BD951F5|nr:uncharacterized protein LOC108110458 [Drosophila eugracilis]
MVDKKLPIKYRKWLGSTIHFFVLYFDNCCIHGFRYLTTTMLILFEKILWLALLIASIYFCVIVCLSSFDRYYTKSTHIGVERNYFFWNTTLPSVTVCTVDRLNDTLFGEYCRNNGIKGPQKVLLWDFLENLANATYTNFQNIPESDEIDQVLKDIGLKPEKYMELIFNLTYDRTYEPNYNERIRSQDGTNHIHVRQVLTEWGLCYMTNSRLSEKYSAQYAIFGKYPELNVFQREEIQYQHGTYFSKDAQYTILGFKGPAIISFLHSAFDIMKVDANSEYAYDGVSYDLSLEEIIAEDNLEKDTTVTMRKCRFQHESNLTHFPFYTRTICQQECRLNLAYEICKCIPHFYPNRIKNPKPVCDYKILRSCFTKHTNYLLKMYEQKGKHKRSLCYCDQNCIDSVVTLRALNSMAGAKNLLGGLGTAVSVKKWPQNRLKRQVIFSMTDLLVSIGGTAGLFLGFSVLGFVEVLYFFTIRLVWQILGYTL